MCISHNNNSNNNNNNNNNKVKLEKWVEKRNRKKDNNMFQKDQKKSMKVKC